MEGRYRQGERGVLAECHLQVNERVEGYRDRGENKLYRDLRQQYPGMTPKTRDFRTTGVVMRVDEDWFRRPGVKQELAESLRELMMREYSISPQDVAAAATNISVIRNGQREAVSNALVLFDATHGTLRLTEPAYLRLGGLVDRLERSVLLTPPDDGRVSQEVVRGLRDWVSHLGDDQPAEPEMEGLWDGEAWIQVFEVGSIVARRDNQGVLHDMEIVGHEFSVYDEKVQLFYLYKTGKPMKAMASAESVQAVGRRMEHGLSQPRDRGEAGVA